MMMEDQLWRSTMGRCCLSFRRVAFRLVGMATSSIRGRSPKRVGGEKSFGLIVMLLALFSLAMLSSAHEMNPNAHGAPHSLEAASDDHDDHESGGADLGAFDHVAAHAGLHGIGLPVVFLLARDVAFATNVWHPVDAALGGSTDPVSILRPPKA